MGRPLELEGRRFGRLTVVKRHSSSKLGIKWLCRCECGHELPILAGALNRGHTKSCGCLNKDLVAAIGRRNYKGEGVSALKTLYRRYRYGAESRGYSFLLDIQLFSSLIKQNCYYCGSAPNTRLTRKEVDWTFLYNGIDRKDNSLGYSVENCVPCCKRCNVSKLNQSHLEFLSMVKSVYERHFR